MTATYAAPVGETFLDLGVDQRIVDALASYDIVHPFPIQALTLPVALAGHDIIGQAKTGTGKTLGFGIPLLQKAAGPDESGWNGLEAPGKPQAVVIVPTRELAVQVAGDLELAATNRSVRVLQVYGGRAFEPQIAALNSGVEVVVGTPGRMIDLMRQGRLDLGHVTTVVLDEADEMLDMGFLPNVETLLAAMPTERHTMLFSATMPGPVVTMARRYMVQATHIRAQDPEDEGATVKDIHQVAYRVHSLNKVEILARLLQAKDRGRTIIFARTKRTAAKVADDLAGRGFAAASIHGDLGQGAREQALRAFRKGKVDVLVATDVAARGIDVDDVTHVINFQCPEDDKIYLHRTGRTGRAGNKGTAITFVDWDEMPRWGLINKALDLGISEPPETYHTSDHLYSDLDIDASAGSFLPKAQRTLAGLAAEEVEDLGETGKRRFDGRSKARSRASGSAPRTHDPKRRQGGGKSRQGAQGGQAKDRPLPDAESPVRRQRSRRRTRGGKPVAPSSPRG
ncbi:MAG: DEAD/DEAH box helicase [Micrococcales bacterium]|nr:DEAD/DEAH box helicase [Micrococcales bacterium]